MAVDRTPEFRQCTRDSQALLPQNTTIKPRRTGHGKHEGDQLSRATAVAYMQDAYTIVNICNVNLGNGLLINHSSNTYKP
jgi:hypothetical protein